MNPEPLKVFFETKARLDEKAKASGRPSAIPAEVYPYLATALDDALEYENHSCTCNADQAEYLLGAARNMAIFAVRENKSEWLLSGLSTLLVEGGRTDARITMVHLAMLNHASGKIGVSFKTLSEPIVKKSRSAVAKWVEAFNARSPHDKSLECFGYKEVLRGGEFDFKCTW